jgi:hypothetical protein
MISKKKRTIFKSKKKYGGTKKSYIFDELYRFTREPPVYNESYRDSIDFYNRLETQLNQIRDAIYINNRDSEISNNSVLEANKESLIAQMDNIKITNPEAYKYIDDLIIYKYYENQEKRKETQMKNRENTNWDRNIVSNFFAEYQDRKFANGFFYLDGKELKNKFSNLNPVNRQELISNIKKLDMRLFHLLQLIIQKRETRDNYIELLNILDDNQVLQYAFQ